MSDLHLYPTNRATGHILLSAYGDADHEKPSYWYIHLNQAFVNLVLPIQHLLKTNKALCEYRSSVRVCLSGTFVTLYTLEDRTVDTLVDIEGEDWLYWKMNIQPPTREVRNYIISQEEKEISLNSYYVVIGETDVHFETETQVSDMIITSEQLHVQRTISPQDMMGINL